MCTASVPSGASPCTACLTWWVWRACPSAVWPACWATASFPWSFSPALVFSSHYSEYTADGHLVWLLLIHQITWATFTPNAVRVARPSSSNANRGPAAPFGRRSGGAMFSEFKYLNFREFMTSQPIRNSARGVQSQPKGESDRSLWRQTGIKGPLIWSLFLFFPSSH